ncbi:MAG: hypothetical protein WD042_12230 [Phycisphaeraceae bacterium]
MSQRSLLPVGLFTVGYMLAAVPWAWVSGNQEFLIYIVVMLLLIGVVLIVDRRVHFSSGVLWGLSVWGLLHMAGGLVPVPASWSIDGDIAVLYSWWLLPPGTLRVAPGAALKYDNVVHAFGFGVTTCVCWQGLRAALPGARPTLGVLVLCAAAAMGFGALNEVVEFFTTLVADTNVGGYVNTGWDLVANAVGAMVAAGMIRWREGSSPMI